MHCEAARVFLPFTDGKAEAFSGPSPAQPSPSPYKLSSFSLGYISERPVSETRLGSEPTCLHHHSSHELGEGGGSGSWASSAADTAWRVGGQSRVGNGRGGGPTTLPPQAHAFHKDHHQRHRSVFASELHSGRQEAEADTHDDGFAGPPQISKAL
uniref:Uncharacterized protein n=1 Tax=Oryza sativa subsp. japonica TaxID=39947 RepID=Q5VMB2_ORYSJ|nr:hypothetical protein [Oryza sativa Japonica Group]BAD69413.1 hypothetical protein [Oryza sativa Japonica Group]